jgi:hypothetical protein
MRRLAIRSALSGKVADGQLKIIDKLQMDVPRTKDILAALRGVGIERSALIVTAEPDRAVVNSARNLQKTKVLPARYLNVLDMLNHQGLLITEDAVKVAEGLWAVKAAPKAEKAAPKPRAAAQTKAEAAAEPALELETEVVAEAPAVEEAKAAPRRRAATKKEAPEAKAGAEADEKPKPRAARAKKDAADTGVEEKKPAPRRRTKKSEEGEG